MAISLPSTKLRRLASTFLRRFRDDQSGSVAIVFAVAASVATMLAGAAIDYSRGVGAQAKLQTAVDQALLAEGGRVALLVDELLGQQQVVVKNLEANYRRVDDVSGATIMGDGRVALILDVGSLVRRSRH